MVDGSDALVPSSPRHAPRLPAARRFRLNRTVVTSSCDNHNMLSAAGSERTRHIPRDKAPRR
eukprot:2427437-Rhodomonas_salina.1